MDSARRIDRLRSYRGTLRLNFHAFARAGRLQSDNSILNRADDDLYVGLRFCKSPSAYAELIPPWRYIVQAKLSMVIARSLPFESRSIRAQTDGSMRNSSRAGVLYHTTEGSCRILCRRVINQQSPNEEDESIPKHIVTLRFVEFAASLPSRISSHRFSCLLHPEECSCRAHRS